MTKLKELERRLKDEPDNLGLRVMVASALHEAGRRSDSVELYRSVALAYRDQGRTQQAIAVCRSVLAFAPDDDRSQRLLASLVSGVDRQTPPRLPRPPLPGPAGAETDVDPAGDAETETDAVPMRRSSGFDVTPLPAPLPYHLVEDPSSSPALAAAPSHMAAVVPSDLPGLRPSDLPTSLQDELARYPKIAGIANAARQISASLIAASGLLRDDYDLSGELETRRLPRISADELLKISGPPPLVKTEQISVPEPIDSDDEPTFLPPAELLAGPSAVDEETTVLRDMPHQVRSRPPSIASPTAASGPLTGAFFVPVPPRNRAAVLQRFRRRMAANGTTVIRRGEIGHGLVIVVRGLLELQVDRADGARVVLGAIAPGEYVGETSLLAHAPAAVNVVAAVDSELMVLGETDFHEVTGAFPALWNELKHVAERRTREQEQRLLG